MKSEYFRPAFSPKQGEHKLNLSRYSNSIHSQCSRILEFFENEGGKQSTFQLRRKGIMHPGGRVKDLRNRGYRIVTHFVREPDENAVLHRIALYVFHGKEENKDGNK